MTRPVISLENISKVYRLGVINSGTFRGDMKRWWAKMRGLPDPFLKIGREDHGNRDGETVWALKDINFQIRQGDTVGFIGRNGAGKSTLLKILSRTTSPTTGEIKVKGRVASLLEVGTGFHPELTGRENLYLNGAILGMNKSEINRKFDEIVDFSGVEKYIDTPVKRYSSGMHVRLAFAVAAHLDPDILIVDEVLAVGDADFQKKCLGKMGDVAQHGRTVLFVSHNMSAIQDLCQKVYWLDKGSIVKNGPARNIIGAYLNKQNHIRSEQRWDVEHAPGNENARVIYAGVTSALEDTPDYLTVETPLIIKFKVFNYRPDIPLHFNFHLYNNERVCVFNTASSRQKFPYGIVEGRCYIPGNLLNDDTYSVNFMVHFMVTAGVSVEDAIRFEVHDAGREGLNWYGDWIGAVRPKLDWQLHAIGSDV